MSKLKRNNRLVFLTSVIFRKENEIISFNSKTINILFFQKAAISKLLRFFESNGKNKFLLTKSNFRASFIMIATKDSEVYAFRGRLDLVWFTSKIDSTLKRRIWWS